MNENLISLQECQKLVEKIAKIDNNKLLIKNYEILDTNCAKTNFGLKITLENKETKILQFLVTKFLEPNNNFMWKEFAKNGIEMEFMPKWVFLKNNLMVYEDLRLKGYENSAQSLLDLKQVKMVLEKLVELHASSFSFEAKKLEQLNSNQIQEYKIENEYNIQVIRKNFPNTYKENISFFNLFNDNFRLRKDLNALIEKWEQKRIPLKFPKTICHSNLEKRNILFKYNKNRELIDCKLVGATPNYFPPAYDFLQLIFFNTNQELRKNYLPELTRYYYQLLKDKLELFSENLEEILSFDDFRISLNYLIPLIKLETVYYKIKNKENCKNEAFEELKEILNFPKITRENCYEIIENTIERKSYELLSFSQTSLGEINGYLGDYIKLKITIKENSIEKTLNLFLKLIPNGLTPLKIISDAGGFQKEAFFYQTIIPMLIHEFSMTNITDYITKCYLILPENFMVFQDLSLEGYKGLSNLETFSYEALEVIMKKLALFHGNMIVFEEKWLEKNGKSIPFYDYFKKYISESYFLKNDKSYGARLMQTGLKSVRDVINLFPEMKTDHNQNLLSKYWDKLEERFYTAILPSGKYRNVLAHGDLWTSNVLFRFQDNKPVDCKFIDFQVIRYCPPAHDILCILQIANNRATRALYQDRVIEVYYKELSRVLSSYQFDIRKILPYDSFLESLDYVRPQTVLMSIMYNEFSTTTSEQRERFLNNDEMCEFVFINDRKQYVEEMMEISPVFKSWLKDDVEELYELCESFEKN